MAEKTHVEPCPDSKELVSFSIEPMVHPASNVEVTAVLSLPELEALALTNNPTIRQLKRAPAYELKLVSTPILLLATKARSLPIGALISTRCSWNKNLSPVINYS